MNTKIVIYLIIALAILGALIVVFYPEPQSPQPPLTPQPSQVTAENPIKNKLEEIRKRRGAAPPEERAREDMDVIYHVIREFERDKNRVPESLDELVSAKHSNGLKFLSEDKVTDPWGSRYVYQKNGTKSSEVKVTCMGSDRIQNTADDLEGVQPTPLPSLFPR
ncbi:type II secretion system protein GspG [Candidatus Sumerlaeota bacterium]|nr:type II secretion system protein GspG [Candidatus Sumerlaeota bacterium]